MKSRAAAELWAARRNETSGRYDANRQQYYLIFCKLFDYSGCFARVFLFVVPFWCYFVRIINVESTCRPTPIDSFDFHCFAPTSLTIRQNTMTRFATFFLFCLLVSSHAVQHLQDPIGSVQGVVGRLLGPDYVTAFDFYVIPADAQSGHDVFELDANVTCVLTKDGGQTDCVVCSCLLSNIAAVDPAESCCPRRKVVIRGNSGVSLAAGVHWYLKYYCNASIAWGKAATGNQLSSVPPAAELPLPAAERRVSPVQYRYAYNVCTFVSRLIRAPTPSSWLLWFDANPHTQLM